MLGSRLKRVVSNQLNVDPEINISFPARFYLPEHELYTGDIKALHKPSIGAKVAS